MREQIYIHNDEQACIVLSKDHHNAIVVQLAVYVFTLVPNIDNQLIYSRNTKVIYEAIIATTTHNFKNAVADSIKLAQHKLSEVQQQHKVLDGVLNDYYSAYRDLNEPREQ